MQGLDRLEGAQMNRRLFLFWLANMGLGARQGAKLGKVGEKKPDELLRDALTATRQKHGVPALAGAFASGDGTVICDAVGVCRVGGEESVSRDDAFHLGSCTKAMTATMLARLVEREVLAWETTVAEAFPDLQDRLHPKFRQATLYHFLAHRSGLPDDTKPDAVIFLRLKRLTEPMREQRRRMVGWLLSRPPAYPPGEKMVYANAGYVVAAAMAEAVTGRSWEELMSAELFEPLDMESVGFGAPPKVYGHDHSGRQCQPITPSPESDNPPALAPAGGVHCSLNDWARFALLHLKGAQREQGLLLKPETFRKLHDDPFQQGYALGWLVVKRSWAKGIAFTHAGSNTLWFAVIWLAPNRNAAFLAAANCGGEHAFRACDDAIGRMIELFL
jgi:CubicO group peptidase (beta-lactamase class C family)